MQPLLDPLPEDGACDADLNPYCRLPLVLSVECGQATALAATATHVPVHLSRLCLRYSIVTLAARITAPQRCVSALTISTIRCGVPPTPLRCIRLRWACVSGAINTSLMAALSLATMGGGVFGGAEIAFQVSDTKPASPASCMVGTSGSSATRVGVVTARILALPALCISIDVANSLKKMST